MDPGAAAGRIFLRERGAGDTFSGGRTRSRPRARDAPTAPTSPTSGPPRSRPGVGGPGAVLAAQALQHNARDVASRVGGGRHGAARAPAASALLDAAGTSRCRTSRRARSRRPSSARSRRATLDDRWTIDAASGMSRAPAAGGRVSVTGEAAWVVDAPGADLFVVIAVQDGAPVAVRGGGRLGRGGLPLRPDAAARARDVLGASAVGRRRV